MPTNFGCTDKALIDICISSVGLKSIIEFVNITSSLIKIIKGNSISAINSDKKDK